MGTLEKITQARGLIHPVTSRRLITARVVVGARAPGAAWLEARLAAGGFLEPGAPDGSPPEPHGKGSEFTRTIGLDLGTWTTAMPGSFPRPVLIIGWGARCTTDRSSIISCPLAISFRPGRAVFSLTAHLFPTG